MEQSLFEELNRLSDHDLIRLSSFRQHEYTPEARDVLRAVLDSRGLEKKDVRAHRQAYLTATSADISCPECGEELTLDLNDLLDGLYTCPSCGREGIVPYNTVKNLIGANSPGRESDGAGIAKAIPRPGTAAFRNVWLPWALRTLKWEAGRLGGWLSLLTLWLATNTVYGYQLSLDLANVGRLVEASVIGLLATYSGLLVFLLIRRNPLFPGLATGFIVLTLFVALGLAARSGFDSRIHPLATLEFRLLLLAAAQAVIWYPYLAVSKRVRVLYRFRPSGIAESARPGSFICGSCGSVQGAIKASCTECGTRLEAYDCPVCGGLVLTTYGYCPHCGCALT